jgi:hypothetical protein
MVLPKSHGKVTGNLENEKSQGIVAKRNTLTF